MDTVSTPSVGMIDAQRAAALFEGAEWVTVAEIATHYGKTAPWVYRRIAELGNADRVGSYVRTAAAVATCGS